MQKTLREFREIHSDSERPLKSRFRELELGNWATFNELKIDFPSVSILKDNPVVFNMKGNHYGLIVTLNLEYQTGWIRFFGTHAANDKVNANSI